MGIHARARKRAEADALKKRFDVDFAEVVVGDGEPEFMDGEVVGSGDAISTPEQTHEHRDPAQALADLGYAPAPVIPEQPKPAPKPNGSGTPKIPQMLIDAGLAENIFEASGMLNKAPNAIRNDSDKALAWATVYREQRTKGVTVDEAAAQATEVTNGGAA